MSILHREPSSQLGIFGWGQFKSLIFFWCHLTFICGPCLGIRHHGLSIMYCCCAFTFVFVLQLYLSILFGAAAYTVDTQNWQPPEPRHPLQLLYQRAYSPPNCFIHIPRLVPNIPPLYLFKNKLTHEWRKL